MRKQADLILLLQKYGEQRRMSHSRLAQKLGVSPMTLSQWLQGHRKMRADECERVERFVKGAPETNPIREKRKSVGAGDPVDAEKNK